MDIIITLALICIAVLLLKGKRLDFNFTVNIHQHTNEKEHESITRIVQPEEQEPNSLDLMVKTVQEALGVIDDD